MSTTDCLLAETLTQLEELKSLGFSYEIGDCSSLSKISQLYIRKRRAALVKAIYNTAKRTKSKAYLRLKLRHYKYVATYAKLSITI